MANFGKRPINDAAKYQTGTNGQKLPEFWFEGELRIDRQPYGNKQRFVDPVGNVITLQISQPGDPKAAETANRIRMEKRMEGWLEHARCPLRHGGHLATRDLEREFKKMPSALRDPCASDPKVMTRENGELHAQRSCPHVEWLIADRVAREKIQNEKRNKARILEEKRKAEAAELQAMQLEMVKEQVKEHKARKGKAKEPTE